MIAGEIPALVGNGRDGKCLVNDNRVVAQRPYLQVAPSVRAGEAVGFPGALAILGMNRYFPVFSQQVGLRPAMHGQQRRIHRNVAPVRIKCGKAQVSLFDSMLENFIRFAHIRTSRHTTPIVDERFPGII